MCDDVSEAGCVQMEVCLKHLFFWVHVRGRIAGCLIVPISSHKAEIVKVGKYHHSRERGTKG